MFIRMIRGALVRQRGKMFLIAFTIALGASLATAMLNVMLDVGDKVNQELKTYGANITVKPNSSTLLSSLYDVEDEGEQIETAYLNEEDVSKLKTIFWAYNIVDFAPFMKMAVTLEDGNEAEAVGTWFNHHLDLTTGESLDAGVVSLRSWWEVTDGSWIDEQNDPVNTIMVGRMLAVRQGWNAGRTVTLTGPRGSEEVTIAGIYDAGGDEDEQIYAPLMGKWSPSKSAPSPRRTMIWRNARHRTRRPSPRLIMRPGTARPMSAQSATRSRKLFRTRSRQLSDRWRNPRGASSTRHSCL